MTISGAIQSAFSGLNATQAAMAVVAENVSNSGTVGYTRRVLVTAEKTAGDNGIGVEIKGAQRVLDTLVQKQLRLEISGSAYTGVKKSYHTALDKMFDAPGGTGSLPTVVNGFTSTLRTLLTDPSSYTTRQNVVSAASNLAGTLNSLSGQVQALRQNAEDSIALAVTKVNGLLNRLESLNAKMSKDPNTPTGPALLDQRDTIVDGLAELLDVKATVQTDGTLRVSTGGGLQLFDGAVATRLQFKPNSDIGPANVYSSDPAKRTVGTISVNGVDMLAAGLIKSGEIAGYIELRDEVLPQAQTQLDALAAGLASALSSKPVPAAAAAAAGATGFEVDLTSLKNGNPITVRVKDGSTEKTVTFVRAGSAGAAAAASAGGEVVGIDFSGGMGSVATQVGAKLTGFAVSNPSGNLLRVLDDGAAGTRDVVSLTASGTVTGLQDGSPEFTLFTDGTQTYTGSFENGSQFTGFASRITLNTGVRDDSSKLVQFAAATPAGDTARPEFILKAITNTSRAFTGKAGIGGSSSPFTGNIVDFASQVVVTQANAANVATGLDEGQKAVLNGVLSRFSDESGVNIDTEMTQLIQLQTAYGANARVMSAAKQMIDQLMAVLG